MNESLDDATQEAMDQMQRDLVDPDFNAKLNNIMWKSMKFGARILTAPFIVVFILLLVVFAIVIIGVTGPCVAPVAAARWIYGCKKTIPPSWTSKNA